MSTDAYEFWRAALKAAPTEWPEAPQPGIYKMRPAKGANYVPVQIWLTDADGTIIHTTEPGSVIAGWINGKPATTDQIANRWLWCKPITKAEREYYEAHGMWPGDIGHNSGDLSLAEEVADAAQTAADWLNKNKITDKVSCDTAANHRAKLNALAKRADDERDAKKRPHMEAAKAVDAEYKPLIETAKGTADRLRDAMTVWMREQDAKQRAIAEAARKAAEEAAKAQGMDDVPMPLFEAPKVQAGGQRGRKAGLRTVTRYEVTDIKAVLEALANNADLHEAAADIARKLMKAGQAVPGMAVVSEQVAA